ncbi:MAG: aminoglycoside phosphotransferase family protein [Flavobacteriaceae bacterium]
MGQHSILALQTILEKFSVPLKQYLFKSLTDGFINDTFLVLDHETPKYILQRVNHSVFKNIAGLMGNIDLALNQLEDPAYTKIELIKTKAETAYLYDSSGYWRLMTYIDKSEAHNTTVDPKIAFEAGRIIAKFHELLKDAPINDYVDTIPRFHDLELRKTQFQEAISGASTEKLKIAKEAIDFAKKVLVTLSELTKKALPIRVCHNDTKLNNILFSKKDDTALCLIDLDTLMKGYFYYDFGDAVRTIANTAPEDEQDHSKITFNKTLFEAFVDGLGSTHPFLSQEELDTLHLGAVFMPFIHGLRALTDYLMGNVYYKVAYENQNLDRCLSLFNFTGKALDQVPYMKKTIAQKLGKPAC